MMEPRRESLDYSDGTGTGWRGTVALVSFCCWVGLVACIVTHVLIVEMTVRNPLRFPSLRGLEPAARLPLFLAEMLLWGVGIATGTDASVGRGRRRWLAILSSILCFLTVPAAVVLYLMRYAPV